MPVHQVRHRLHSDSFFPPLSRRSFSVGGSDLIIIQYFIKIKIVLKLFDRFYEYAILNKVLKRTQKRLSPKNRWMNDHNSQPPRLAGRGREQNVKSSYGVAFGPPTPQRFFRSYSRGEPILRERFPPLLLFMMVF